MVMKKIHPPKPPDRLQNVQTLRPLGKKNGFALIGGGITTPINGSGCWGIGANNYGGTEWNATKILVVIQLSLATKLPQAPLQFNSKMAPRISTLLKVRGQEISQRCSA